MNISEQKKHLEANPKLDAKLIAIAGENLGWELKEYADDCLRFYIKPSVLGDGETLTVKLYNGNPTNVGWEIASRTQMKVLPSFTKNWFNVKKMYEEIIMLLEYDNLEKETSALPIKHFNIPDKPWYTSIPWLSIIIVLIHGYIFWMFNQEVRDDAWQAESWMLKDAGAFDRSLYYDGEWTHILKSFFFDFRPGILYVSVVAILALGYTIETTMPRWFLLLILIVSGMAGMLWAFDRSFQNISNHSQIYDLSQATFATMFGIYIVALFTRAIYFPFQRVVTLALFAYFGYWSMKSGYFWVVDKHVFMGSWLFGMMGGLCWYIPYNVVKIKKLVAPLSIFAIYIVMAFWVYKTVNHDYLCMESFKKWEEKVVPYLRTSYYNLDVKHMEEKRSDTEKALIKLNELLTYKTTKAMWDVNVALKKYLQKIIADYDYMLKQTENSFDYNINDANNIETSKLFQEYYDAVNMYWEKEHVRLAVIQ